MGVGCPWDPWSTVSRSDTHSARTLPGQCGTISAPWIVAGVSGEAMLQDMLVGSVFGIILPESAWLHSRWLVQHNDYVAADSWTQWSVIVLDGGIPANPVATFKPCICSCYSATLPETQKPYLNAVLDTVLAFYHLKPQGRCGIFSGSKDVRLFQGLYPLTTLILDALVRVGVW